MLEAQIGDTPRFDLTVGLPLNEFRQFIQKVYALGASDITIRGNDYVWADINRRWCPVTLRRLETSEADRALTILNDQSALGLIGSGRPVDARVDLPLTAEDVIEFRMNATGCMVNGSRDSSSITLRAIPKSIPELSQLGIEQEIVDNLFPRYGLILTVGTTGSGKSTLQASANAHRLIYRRHDPVSIITYEDPIEYSLGGLSNGFMPEPCQSGIGEGQHLRDFDLIGPNAMRRRADVIVMGEIRDVKTAKAAGELSRTGHAVQATMHVDTPGECFDRFIKFFPSEQQDGEAFALLSQLRMVIAQKLARRKDGGKIAFRSWIVIDKAIRNELAIVPTSKWSLTIAEKIKANGNDFESCAFRALCANLITGEVFREISGLTMREAVDYVIAGGGDVNLLG